MHNDWKELERTLENCFAIAVASLVFPLKLVLFSVHNLLTERDYGY